MQQLSQYLSVISVLYVVDEIATQNLDNIFRQYSETSALYLGTYIVHSESIHKLYFKSVKLGKRRLREGRWRMRDNDVVFLEWFLIRFQAREGNHLNITSQQERKGIFKRE